MKERELTYSEETNISQHWVLNRMYQWSHMGVKLNIILGQLFSSEDARLQKCSSYQVSVFEYFLNSPFLVLFFFFILFIWVLSFGCTGPSLLCAGFSRQRLLVWNTGSRRTGSAALRHAESSRARIEPASPCTGRRILTLVFNLKVVFSWTTRKVPTWF